MVEKIASLRHDRCRKVIGRVDDATLAALDRLLALVLGLTGE